MTKNSTKTNKTRSAGWLSKLIGLSQGFTLVMGMFFTLSLIVCFPLWGANVHLIDLPFTVKLNTLSFEAETTELVGLTADSFEGVVSGRIENPWVHWLYLLSISMAILLIFLILKIFRQIVGTIATNEIFSCENAKRLRWLGVLFLIGAVYEPIIFHIFSRWAVDLISSPAGTLAASGVPYDILDKFITGWILLILSEVFRHGTEMQQEQSLTI